MTSLGMTACAQTIDARQELASSQSSDLQAICEKFSPENLPHNAQVTSVKVERFDNKAQEFCSVRGVIVSNDVSTIEWEVELPPKKIWNGKTLTRGGGGFDGFIPTDSQLFVIPPGAPELAFARMSSDSGHKGRTMYPWALDDIALRNHAYDANHFTLEVGTVIATQYYGTAPSRRYMQGTSNGGRSGLLAAERYPNDYDGIIALVPAINQQSHEANVGIITGRHIYSDPSNWMSPADVALYAAAEIAACDELDGLADGVIANVQACHYAPTNLLCEGEKKDQCLTSGQIETVRLIYADKNTPVTMADGVSGYRGFGRGGAATTDWNIYMLGTSFEAKDSFNFFVADNVAKVVSNDPEASAMTIDPAKYSEQYRRLSNEMDVINPDFSAFADQGGKLIIFYGSSDTCVSVYQMADLYERMKEAMGGRKLSSFSRFLFPAGIGHGHEGPGANKVDLYAALDDWVENDVAPDNLVVSKRDPETGESLFERPLCHYPKFPRYKGSGNPNKANSFICSTQ